MNQEELDKIAEFIFFNETSGNKKLLMHWNTGEDFASMGVFHFVWLPKNYNGAVVNVFPEIMKKFKENNLKLPKILEDNPIYCPWQNQQELLEAKNSAEAIELIDFLYENRGIQALYLVEQSVNVLQEMLNVTKLPRVVETQYNRLTQTKGGFYPILDYINFKGKGLRNPSDYNQQAWGLLQVLEHMQGSEIGLLAMQDFCNCATYVLARRIKNSKNPPAGEVGEERWIKGWTARMMTYPDRYDEF